MLHIWKLYQHLHAKRHKWVNISAPCFASGYVFDIPQIILDFTLAAFGEMIHHDSSLWRPEVLHGLLQWKPWNDPFRKIEVKWVLTQKKHWQRLTRSMIFSFQIKPSKRNHPLVIKHGNGKSPMNGSFSSTPCLITGRGVLRLFHRCLFSALLLCSGGVSAAFSLGTATSC